MFGNYGELLPQIRLIKGQKGFGVHPSVSVSMSLKSAKSKLPGLIKLNSDYNLYPLCRWIYSRPVQFAQMR